MSGKSAHTGRRKKKMDEQYIWAWMFALLAVVLVVAAVRERMRAKQRQVEQLRQNWGQVPEREYTSEELESISHYARNHKNGRFMIDDITWNDLDMERVYMLLNNTCSACGEEYLYAMLRLPEFQPETLEERERVIEFFRNHAKERENVQKGLLQAGKVSGRSVSDYLQALTEIPIRSRARYFACFLLAVASIVCLLVKPAAGVGLFVAAVIVNISVHTVEGNKVEIYLKCLGCMLRILKSSEALGKEKIPELEQYLKCLRENEKKLHGIRKKCVTLVTTKGTEGDFMSVLYSYINSFFMLDLIQFYSVLKEMQRKREELEKLTETLGILDAMIAAASYREYLPYYCIPQFTDGRHAASMDVTDLYHPLIANPVANSIYADGGILVTGSNASGKSTFLKNVAINMILAQSIHTSLSHSYRASMCKVMTSMALHDDLQSGESYYIVEIKSLKRILEESRKEVSVLCIVDEVLRGTNTIERIAASSQVLAYLRNPRVICFAATHDIELSYILDRLYTNYHFEEEITEHDVRFNYLLKEGRATSRNAIALLEMIGYDQNIVRAARASAAEFETQGIWREI